MRIRLSRRAVIDLERAHDFYAGIDPELGDRFLDEFDMVIQRLEMFPGGAPPVDGFDNLRRARMRRFPYGVFYRHPLGTEDLLIVRVLHAGRHQPEALAQGR